MAKNIYNYIVEIYALYYTECVMKALLRKSLETLAKEKNRRVNVALLGLGMTNRALLDLLVDMQDIASVTVRQKSACKHEISDTVSLIVGDNAFDSFNDDVLFPAPSIRRESLNIPDDAIVLTDYDLLFKARPKELFLVSGSDGKSTTVAMASELLYPTFPDIFTGGNIGVPLWNARADASSFLLELSSFTLRYSTNIGGRALLTNVTPNHLDWHESLSEYEDTKLSLLRAADEPILNLDDAVSERAATEINAFALVSTTRSREEILARYQTEHTVTVENGAISIDGTEAVSLAKVKNRERHNVENLILAIAMSIGYSYNEQIRKVASTFSTLKERCERFQYDGVTYISSSIDTTPQRTHTTLTGLGQRVRIILGGRGKGLSPEPLRDVLMRYATRIAIYGEIANEMLSFINSDEGLSKIPHQAFTSLGDAIDYITDGITPRDTVLLSPAATSYGEFTDYKERGEFFKSYVLRKK